jgi:hypothetical protein
LEETCREPQANPVPPQAVIVKRSATQRCLEKKKFILTPLAVLRWMACGHTGPPKKAVAGWTLGLKGTSTGETNRNPTERERHLPIAIAIEMLPSRRWDFGNDCVV